jgi:hypothetical protein
MVRCPVCSGYLQHEAEFLEMPARLTCIGCGWMLSDPNFRKEQPKYFPPDSVDRRIEWRQANPGFDLYEPSSAACQLNTSVSFLKHSIRHDPSAPIVMGRGVIACNTPALQQWWNGKKHHIQVGSLEPLIAQADRR